MKKVILVTNIPNPYRIPLFHALERQLMKKGMALEVVFGASTYSRRKFNMAGQAMRFRHRFLRSGTFHLGDNEKTVFLYNGLLRHIQRQKPDYIVTTGFSVATLKIWLRSFVSRTPFFIWSGSVEKKGRLDSPLRLFIRKRMAARAAACIVYGSRAAHYLDKLGVPSQRIFTAINTVDTIFFSQETKKHRAAVHPGLFHLTTVAYLVPRKNLFKLLATMEALLSRRADFVLDIIGDGEDRPRLEALTHERGLSAHVKFHGYKQRNELPSYLANSSCFLFQTDFDIWGLVLNEAMAAGLPCMVSPHAAASHDLIKEGVTGFIVDFDYPEKAANTVADLLDHPEKARKIGDQAAAYMAQYASIEKSAAGFVDAITQQPSP